MRKFPTKLVIDDSLLFHGAKETLLIRGFTCTERLSQQNICLCSHFSIKFSTFSAISTEFLVPAKLELGIIILCMYYAVHFLPASFQTSLFGSSSLDKFLHTKIFHRPIYSYIQWKKKKTAESTYKKKLFENEEQLIVYHILARISTIKRARFRNKMKKKRGGSSFHQFFKT